MRPTDLVLKFERDPFGGSQVLVHTNTEERQKLVLVRIKLPENACIAYFDNVFINECPDCTPVWSQQSVGLGPGIG